MQKSQNYDAKDVVDKRFRSVSLNNHVNAMLYALALDLEGKSNGISSYKDEMHRSIPNLDECMKMRRKVSLIPLESIKERLKLPSVPGIVLRLHHALESGAASEQLAEIIQYDPKLTTAIMSLVNSPIFALTTKIETLSRAITVLGTKEISSLALGTRLMVMFDDCIPEGLPIQTFWKHSIACGVLAHDIAKFGSRPDPERYFVAGLLHDLGRVMLFSQYPDLAKLALALQRFEGIPLHKGELNLFDVDHTMVGGLFFGEWGLPKSIVHSALYHHDPTKCLGKDVPEIIYVANQISSALGMGCNYIYSMDSGDEIWMSLGINEDELCSLVFGVEDKLWATFNSLFPKCKRNTERA